MTNPDARKLLFGTLLVGASALPAGNLIAGLLAGVGANWVSEAVGGAVAAGPPPGPALARAFARAVQTAAADLHREYGEERARRDGQDAFELLRQTARGLTAVEAPAGAADIVAVQRGVSGGLDQLLHGFPDAQVRLLRERLLPATARAFHEELAREPEAWRLYHSWLLERMAAQNVALHAALAAQPAARAALADPAALEDRLDAFAASLAALLAALQDELRRAAMTGPDIDVDQSGQQGGTSYGAFNSFETGQPPAPPPGKTRVNQSGQKGGASYGAFNSFGKTPPAPEVDDSEEK